MWNGVGDRKLFGPDLIRDSEEKVKLIRDRLKIAQSRQKSYADAKRKDYSCNNGTNNGKCPNTAKQNFSCETLA